MRPSLKKKKKKNSGWLWNCWCFVKHAHGDMGCSLVVLLVSWARRVCEGNQSRWFILAIIWSWVWYPRVRREWPFFLSRGEGEESLTILGRIASFCFFNFYLCFVYLYVHMCVCALTHSHIHIWRPNVDYSLFFETGSYTESRAHVSVRRASQWTPGVRPSLQISQHWG